MWASHPTSLSVNVNLKNAENITGDLKIFLFLKKNTRQSLHSATLFAKLEIPQNFNALFLILLLLLAIRHSIIGKVVIKIINKNCGKLFIFTERLKITIVENLDFMRFLNYYQITIFVICTIFRAFKSFS